VLTKRAKAHRASDLEFASGIKASDRMLELYIREGSLFRDNVAGMVGL